MQIQNDQAAKQISQLNNNQNSPTQDQPEAQAPIP
jgi:hypothetical protein